MDDIIDYICIELHNPQAAEKFYNNIKDMLERLRYNPYLFPLHHDKRLEVEGFHYTMIGNYILFYEIDDDKKVVSIARVIYGRRNISTMTM